MNFLDFDNRSSYLLAGDLGGTKTLLGLYKNDKELTQIHQKRYFSSDWSCFEEILRDFLSDLPKELAQPSFGCIAVAGRVEQGQAKITNLPWKLIEKDLCKSSQLVNLELVNDFAVLIYGLPFLKQHQRVEIQSVLNSKRSLRNSIAIIGAGTGLGIARGNINNKTISIRPSEGGHSEFSPRYEAEWNMSQWLKSELGLKRLSVERVVSGSGLGKIGLWRLAAPDAKDHALQNEAKEWLRNEFKYPDFPSLVSKLANAGDKTMKEVLEIWLSAYGSAAGDLALQELCIGGLWIGGGTASKQINGLRSKTFLQAFSNKGRFSSFLKELPVIALIDPEAGLFSAACRARALAESSEKIDQEEKI